MATIRDQGNVVVDENGTQVWAALPTATGCVLLNASTTDTIFYKWGSTATTNSFPLKPGGELPLGGTGACPGDALYAITEAGKTAKLHFQRWGL